MTKIDFIQDLKPIFSQKLNELGYKTKEKYDVETILYHYFNIIFRLPPVQNWNIKQSQELIDKTDSLRPNIQQGLEKFIKNAERGNDLKPWMSENINKADYRDTMFYDWGIYHFHLGTKTHKQGKNKGLIKRTDEVLLAIAKRNESIMYLIDIRTHDNPWSQQDLIGIIENNWPNRFTLPGVGELLNPPSDDSVKELRKRGINSPIPTSGGRLFISPNGGYATDGSSVLVIADRNNLMTMVKQFEKDFIDYIQQAKLNSWQLKVKYTFVDMLVESTMKIPEILPFFQQHYNKNWNDLEFHLKDISWMKNDYISYRIEELSTGVQLTIDIREK